MFGVSGRTISEKEERAWFAALVIKFVDIFYWREQLVGTVTGRLLIFEPDNLERDLELSTAFSWESFVYLTLTELFPVASLANSSLISLERLHATLFPLDIILLGSGTTSSLFCVYSWLLSLPLSSVIALLYLSLSLANPYVNASHSFLTLVVVTVSYVIIISTVKSNPPYNAGPVRSTERKLTVTLFVVTVVPFLTIVPRTIWHIIPPHMSSKVCPEIFYSIDYSFFALYLLNYIVNPVIYAVRMHEFRKKARKLVSTS